MRSEDDLTQPLVRIRGLSKAFGGVRALHDVSLNIGRSSIHALCGENGAGKSTLIKVLTGVVEPDSGEIDVDQRRLRTGHVLASEQAGIAAMHQESTVFPDLNAIDNIFVGRELTRWRGWWLDRAAMRRAAIAVMERLGEQWDIDVPVRELSLAHRQMVALARALARDCRLLIMDEPTASLSARETRTLLKIARQLRSEGVSVLYVSHRLEEVFAIADTVSVLRDGQLVATHAVSDVDTRRLIHDMVGRAWSASAETCPPLPAPGPILLDVKGLSRRGVFDGIDLQVRGGEIVGLGGLVGAGRSEIARAIFGIDRYDRGVVRIGDRVLPRGSVTAARAAGIALVPEDRQHEGLILPMSIAHNLTMAILRGCARYGLIASDRERHVVESMVCEVGVKAGDPREPAATLSGGNQQKLVLAKWLATQPRVLILDEPTRGIDVAAKTQIHQLIRDVAARGVAVLVISSEFAELLSLCHRIVVVREGRIVGGVHASDATQADLLAMALPDGRGVNA